MTDFIAFLDDSGSPDEGICLGVAGFVSTKYKWADFEKDWHTVLTAYGIGYFHMREYAHSVGQFNGWRGREGKRRTFLKKLISCLSGRVHKSFASAVLLKDYRDVDELYPLHEAVGYPLALCGRTCSAKINSWRTKRKIQEPVEIIFETGSKHANDLARIQKRDGQPEPLFKRKDDFGALQAADLIAWENTKALRDLELGKINGLEDLRKSMSALALIPNDWGVYTKEDLIRSCNLIPLPLRSALATMTPEVIAEWNAKARSAALPTMVKQETEK